MDRGSQIIPILSAWVSGSRPIDQPENAPIVWSRPADSAKSRASFSRFSFRGYSNWLHENWLGVKQWLRAIGLAARKSSRSRAHAVRIAIRRFALASRFRAKASFRNVRGQLYENWFGVKQRVRVIGSAAREYSHSTAHALRIATRRFALASRFRARITFRNVRAWLYEDWLDVKHCTRAIGTVARGSGPSAVHWTCSAALSAHIAIWRFAMTRRRKAKVIFRSVRAWLHDDWLDIKYCVRAARMAVRDSARRTAHWARHTLRQFAIATKVQTAVALRNTGAWLYDDWRDIKYLTRLLVLSTRELPATLWRTGQTGISGAFSLFRYGPPFIYRGLTRAIIHGMTSFSTVLANTARKGVSALASTAAGVGNVRTSHRYYRIRGTVDQNWALFRYWRNRGARYIRSYATETSAREHLLNCCVSLFGLLIAAGGYVAIQNYSENRAQTDFERPAKEVVAFLTQTLNNHVAALESAQHRFTAKKKPPNRWQFFQSARDTLKTLPGIQALEWVPRVSYRYRKRYEKHAVKDGLFGFEFFGPNRVHLDRGRRDYFPIYYVEPYPGNEGSLGFDLATDPVALEALHKARDSGKAITTTYTSIDHSDSGDAANHAAPIVVVVLPVYDTEILPFTARERRQRITGFIRGVIRLDRMVQAYRSNLSVPPGLEVAFYSHTPGAKPRLRYYNPPLPKHARSVPYPGKGKSDDISLTAGFKIVDQNWSMVLRPESRLFLRNLSSASWAFAIFAILTTAILLLYLLTTQTRTRMIERSVGERTMELEAEIAQRKRIEAELRAAKDEAVEANHAKSEFLAIMSHELRTPLNAITGFSEVMESEVFGPLGHGNYGEYVSFIHDSADHLISLINDILDLSKIEAERYEINKEDISLAEAWQPVEDMMAEQIAAAQVTLNNRITETPYVIRADDRALRQIFLNLLSNAVKFTPEGGRIDVWSELDAAGQLLISVRDTGIGISEEDLELVFEPFKQIESKVARKHKGTGLGLPLTQRLVALHGGTVEIDSTPGQGTTVRITLEPNAVVGDSPLIENMERPGWRTASEFSSGNARHTAIRSAGAA